MLLIHLMQEMPTLVSAIPMAEAGEHLPLWHMASDWSLLAQQTFETDVFANTRAWFDNFVSSGQVWALVIGLVIGYLFRSLTTYG